MRLHHENDTHSVPSVVRAKLFQAFLISGGPNGRLAKGDELLEMAFLGDGLENGDHDFLEAPTVL